MAYAWQIGKRYLLSKKRNTISVITVVATTGVALGVGALLVVLSITSGFEDEFRNKVLGVNAHVLVLKYGLDFEEYRDITQKVESSPKVRGAAPFLINEMMLANGERLQNVLVKGVDPERASRVLALPSQIVSGGLEGMRLPGATPPGADGEDDLGLDGELDTFLKTLDDGKDLPTKRVDGAVTNPSTVVGDAAEPEEIAMPERDEALPEVAVPTPGQVEKHLASVSRLDDDGVSADVAGSSAIAGPDDDGFSLDAIIDGVAPQDAAKEEGPLPGIVIGKTLAEELGLAVGDEARVISPLSGLGLAGWSDSRAVTSSRTFKVVGVFEAGFQEYDTRLVYMDLYEAQRFFDHGDTVTGVEVTMHDFDAAPAYARALEKSLGEGPFHTMDWGELNQPLFTALKIQKLMLSLVIATIIFVAAFNVIATLIMVVLEKRREIAILKAVGAANRTVLGMFAIQGMVIGFIGTILGLLLGGGVCAYLSLYEFPLDPKVYLIDHLPLRVTPMEFVVAAVTALFICGTATLIPSWWAARMPPAQGLRYK